MIFSIFDKRLSHVEPLISLCRRAARGLAVLFTPSSYFIGQKDSKHARLFTASCRREERFRFRRMITRGASMLRLRDGFDCFASTRAAGLFRRFDDDTARAGAPLMADAAEFARPAPQKIDGLIGAKLPGEA